VNLADVMDQVADRLQTIPGLRTYAYPVASITPPAAIVAYPTEAIAYDATYGRGSDRFELPVVVMVGKASERAARDALGAYVDGSGPRSVKAVVEAGEYTAFHTIRVTEALVDVVTMAAVDYLAATFSLDIAGSGA